MGDGELGPRSGNPPVILQCWPCANLTEGPPCRPPAGHAWAGLRLTTHVVSNCDGGREEGSWRPLDPKVRVRPLPGSGHLGAWVVLSKGTRRGAQEGTSLHLSGRTLLPANRALTIKFL